MFVDQLHLDGAAEVQRRPLRNAANGLGYAGLYWAITASTVLKGTVLFVGTKRAAGKIVKEQAERAGMPLGIVAAQAQHRLGLGDDGQQVAEQLSHRPLDTVRLPHAAVRQQRVAGAVAATHEGDLAFGQAQGEAQRGLHLYGARHLAAQHQGALGRVHPDRRTPLAATAN